MARAGRFRSRAHLEYALIQPVDDRVEFAAVVLGAKIAHLSNGPIHRD